MEIILNQDVEKLGYKHDLVNVKPGYARNYLIPRGLAVEATPGNKKMLDENLKQQAHKLAKIKADAEKKAKDLENVSVSLKAKTGTSGKIFGSITTKHVAEALKAKGYEVDRKKITLSEEIKTLGTYSASIDLHKEVKAEIQLDVEAEEE